MKLLKVEWRDACVHHGEVDLETIDKKGFLKTSVGFKLWKTKDSVGIAAEIDGDGSFYDVTVIPMKIVVGVVEYAD